MYWIRINVQLFVKKRKNKGHTISTSNCIKQMKNKIDLGFGEMEGWQQGREGRESLTSTGKFWEAITTTNPNEF